MRIAKLNFRQAKKHIERLQQTTNIVCHAGRISCDIFIPLSGNRYRSCWWFKGKPHGKVYIRQH